jgi:Ni,Fe-hydrogenase III large subunit
VSIVETHGGRSVAVPPAIGLDAFLSHIRTTVGEGGRVVALFGTGAVPAVELVAVVAVDHLGVLRVARTTIDGGAYPSLTPDVPQVHLFEREIHEQTGLVPDGHPWLKPVRFTRPGDHVGVMDYYAVEGESVHEVAVGPVHAGIIEPGHFRFQCHGETVFHLEISLGYQHRGIERALLREPAKRTLHLAETLAGDTTIGHATAHCEAIEAISNTRVPPRAHAIRAVALELERLANHVGDLGALAADVAFLPTASYCGRIRGDFLNLTATICGNRFGRSLVVPGGVAFDIDEAMARDLTQRLDAAERDARGAIELMWGSATVMSRFEDTGVVSAATATELGLVGPSARASGLGRDVRIDHPWGLYQLQSVPMSTATTGDVYARARVRWLEAVRSMLFVRDLLSSLPGGPPRASIGEVEPNRFAVAMVEGWRGEIAHVARTDSAGRLVSYKVVDPSFHNWMGLAMALRDQAISDFPVCNKSFNLSYCGHDL